jgi:hypothetical protein
MFEGVSLLNDLLRNLKKMLYRVLQLKLEKKNIFTNLKKSLLILFLKNII